MLRARRAREVYSEYTFRLHKGMKKTAAVITAIAIMLSFGACRSDKKKQTAYFGLRNGHALAEEQVWIDNGLTAEEEALSLVTRLLDGPGDQEHVKTIPEGTTLISLKIKEKTATVNLSQEFEKTKDNAERLLAIYSVVATLCNVEGISRVQILVNGRSVKYASSGEDIGILSMNNVITDDEITRKQTMVVELYFGTEDGEGITKQQRMLEVKNNESMEKTIINELLSGPSDYGIRLIPSDVKLLSIETKDKLCYLNMSREFSAIDDDTAYMAIYSVVNTITGGLHQIEGVQFLVDGERIGYMGGVELSKPLYFNSGIIKEN